MTPAHLRKLPWEFLTKIMNLFLWCRRVPAALLEARTIFIPKCVSPTSPGELRPISIGNVLVRLFHKILANRLRANIHLNPRQKGFEPLDAFTNVDCYGLTQSLDFTDPAGQVSDSFIIKERSKVERCLFLDGVLYNTAERQRQMSAEPLYASVDGRALSASCKTAGQHTWKGVPTLPSVALSSALPVVGVTPVFRCDAYAREFETKTGLGVRKRRAHAVEANNDIDTVRLKNRWSEEEALMLAKAEAELVKRGGVRFMNQELAGMFAERSIEAIKKKRQSQPYKAMVKNFLDALAGPVAPVAPSPPCATNSISSLRPTTRSVGQQGSTAPIPTTQTTLCDPATPTAGPSANSQPTVSHLDQPEIRPIPIMAFREPYRSEMQELDDLTWTILQKLPSSNGIYSAVDIILKLNKDSPREVFLGHLASVIESAVRELTPSETQERKRNRRPAIHRHQLTRRQERKRSYALTQNLYKKNRGRCYKSLISGSLVSEFKVTQAFAQDFWVNLMTPSISSLPVLPARRPSPSPHVKVAALWGRSDDSGPLQKTSMGVPHGNYEFVFVVPEGSCCSVGSPYCIYSKNFKSHKSGRTPPYFYWECLGQTIS
ncbi:Retrovirus-related Pol polyprotein from type-2 retrotransposable element R2DM [Araneus ventricosus]|uniref:Retrovirus-related Pol polyprotein from type-2 retrotransposable element R2DM n=1 Tax=Araneus ventricosus TaxID=182803 RepID=A0A4Y2X999_ARAVE|nr:Retrovirus-related Pol polyprotein from type-2 retrotransposable element R2DM [Araneus ventricosus]GBO45480.1 Retrovirus-related Pol polyprotein from type-2 retrotransposable element R2DM [Araneus ventricosus]